MIDTSELTRQVAASPEPVKTACSVIGAMVAIIKVHRGEEFAADFLIAAAVEVLPALRTATPSPTDI